MRIKVTNPGMKLQQNINQKFRNLKRRLTKFNQDKNKENKEKKETISKLIEEKKEKNSVIKIIIQNNNS